MISKLAKKIVIPIACAFGVAIIVTVIFISYSSKKNIIESSKIQAIASISQFKKLRGYYTKNVVKKIKKSSNMKISFLHDQMPDGIPLPATMIHELSEEFSKSKNGSKLKLYSAYPFPNRKERTLDEFGEKAIDFLTKNPDEVYVTTETLENSEVVRVAMADRMVAEACVQCHNSRADTPKNDWKNGDVRGVLEIIVPIDQQLSLMKETTLTAIVILGVLTILLFIILIRFFRSKIVHPIEQTNEIAKNLADGNFRKKVENVTDDEIGQMATSLNRTVEEIKKAFASEEIEWQNVAEMKERELEALDQANRSKEEAIKAARLAESEKIRAIESQKAAEVSQRDAEDSAKKASVERENATEAMQSAEEQKKKAQMALTESERQKQIANKAMKEAQQEKEGADRALREAEHEKDKAQIALRNADVEKQKAERAAGEAQRAQEDALIAKESAEAVQREQTARNESLRQAVVKIQNIVKRAAGGDFTQNLDESMSGEIGDINRSLNELFENLRNTLDAITTQTNTVNRSSDDIRTVTEDLSQNALLSKNGVNAMTSESQSVSDKMAEVSSNSEQLAASILEVSKVAKSVTCIAADSVKSSAEAQKSIRTLADTGTTISDFVKTINSIASQTNLLALNATIESARAGAAGSGFAVVANEVKELAKQTEKATSEISEMVQTINKDAEAAVSSISSVVGKIEEINGLSSSVALAVDEQNSATHKIASNVRDMVSSINNLDEQISSVTVGADNTEEGARLAKESAVALERLSNDLKSLLSNFKFQISNTKLKQVA